MTSLIDPKDYFVQLGQIKTTGTDEYGQTTVTSTNTVSNIAISPSSVTVKADDELWTVVDSQGTTLFSKARILSVQAHAPWWDTVLFKEIELDVSRGI